MPMIHIGRKVPKGFKELPGSIHLGKGVWMFNIEPIAPIVSPLAERTPEV